MKTIREIKGIVDEIRKELINEIKKCHSLEELYEKWYEIIMEMAYDHDNMLYQELSEAKCDRMIDLGARGEELDPFDHEVNGWALEVYRDNI